MLINSASIAEAEYPDISNIRLFYFTISFSAYEQGNTVSAAGLYLLFPFIFLSYDAVTFLYVSF